MVRNDFEARAGGTAALDLCPACRVIWFDWGEANQLAPRSVIDLFVIIFRQQQDEHRRPLAGKLACPRCHDALLFTHDVNKNGRFTYFRCLQSHGRLTPFTEFLREKRFVRILAPAEVERVRAQVKQLRCSGCGAPVDLSRGSACAHCGAPVTVLDAGAVENALRMWTAEMEARDEQRDRIAAMLLNHGPELPGHCLGFGNAANQATPRVGEDLIDNGIRAVGGMLQGFGIRV